MHRYDERTARIADAVFAYTRARLELEPIPLDHSIAPDELTALVPNLIQAAGNDPDRVLALFEDVLAPAGISCGSPRFFAFIPAAPPKAPLPLGMIVACSSVSGIPWVEVGG